MKGEHIKFAFIQKGRKGFAVLTVIFVMVTFSMLGITAVSLVTGSAEQMRDEYHTQQAFDVATAGLEFVTEQLSGDSDWSDEADFSKNFGPGSFSVTYTDKLATSIVATVAGTVEGITREVMAGFSSGGSGPAAFAKAVYVDGDIVVESDATGDIQGDIAAGGGVGLGGMTQTGDSEDNNQDSQIPQADWAYWQNVSDYQISGNHTFSTGTYTGIYYITGDVTFSGDGITIQGTIVALGNVDMIGHSDVLISTQSGHPSIVSGGSVSLVGNTGIQISGWIWAAQNFSAVGTSDLLLNGGITAGGDFVMTGNTNVDINYSDKWAPDDGFGGGEGEGGGVATTVWSEVF